MQPDVGPAPNPAPLVLVADDDRSIGDLVTAVLTDAGFRCATAPDGEQLLRLVGQAHPAAVVLDIRMPVLDGFGVMARLRADPALCVIPVVAMSANADPARALAAGCRAFLPKPFDVDDLLAAVHAVVGARQAGPTPADLAAEGGRDAP